MQAIGIRNDKYVNYVDTHFFNVCLFYCSDGGAMLLENQYREIKWTKKNIEHYQNKGYEFTHYGDKFLVNANDLSPYSKLPVEVICDYCGKQHTVPYNSYIKGHKTINKDSCTNCVGNKCAEITLLKRQDALYQKLLDKCQDNNYRLLTKKNDIKNNLTVIDYECYAHGVHHMRIANMLSGKKCPDCSRDNNRKHFQLDKNHIQSEIEKYGGVLLNPDDYINNQTKNLKVICPECKKEFVTSLRSFVQHGGQVCKECSKKSESIGERKIRYYLEDNSIEYLQEHWFPDCRDKRQNVHGRLC